jgi:hypothetical protein
MGEFSVNNFYMTFNIEDKSLKKLFINGIYVGEYRNDVFCKWYATQDIVVADFQKYICGRLEDTVGYSIGDKRDTKIAIQDLKRLTGMSVSEWLEEWMVKETREERLQNG